MTGKREIGAPWHQTTVVLQADIYRQALEQGIDISDACNRALAGLTGVDYHRQQQKDVPAPPPVIIAGNDASPQASGGTKKVPAKKLPPVINADDPAAPVRVVQAKAPAKKVLPEIPVPAPSPEEVPPAFPAAATKKAAVSKKPPAPAKKKSRGDALKTFFSSKIVSTDEAGEVLGKDELYELFARFCREHHITPVPERKKVIVALKNQFALTEKLVNGTPSWTGIRLK
jgi:hypothetical protein